MGYTELPNGPPSGGGRMSASLVLGRHELMETIDLLKAALAEYTQGMANGQLANLQLGRSASQAAPAGPYATLVPPAIAPPLLVPQPSVVRPGAVPLPQPQPVQQQQQQQPQLLQQPYQQQQQQPLGLPSLHQQMAQLHLQQPQPQVQPQALQPQPVAMPQQQVVQQRPPQVQQPQPQVQLQPYVPATVAQPQPRPVQPYPAATAAVPAARPAASDAWSSSAAVPAAAPPPSPPAASTRWKMVFTSDPEDHSKTAVSAMAYAQTLPGLPGGDGHAGWLVSASKGVLNLWETNIAASGQEMALLCMHQQAVDVHVSKLVLEPATKLCFGAALGSGSAIECVSVHSLDPESLLASRYKFAPPGNRTQVQQRLMQQVESLHSMIPSLKNHIVATYGERLLVFRTKPENTPEKDRGNSAKYTRTGSMLHDPEFHFVAHPGSVITALHRSPLEGSCTLITGAQDGKIHMWDLKAPPKQPTAQLIRHTKNVTGLNLISDDRLASSSTDGTVLLWDLRSPSSPLYKATAPGGSAVLKIAAGPWGDLLAVSTAKGLHCLELFEFEAPMTNIAAYPLQRPFTEIMFNTKTHDLYAGCSDGSIQVFSRQL